MKKNFLFMSVMASLFMVGCSQEEFTPDGGDNGSGEARTSYMAVNLVSPDVTKGTRAKDGYEDGDETENKVNKVRFYFFTANGAIANVKYNNGSYVNYYDWSPTTGDQIKDPNEDDDVESILKAKIVINTKDGDKLPHRIAAVLNPPTIGGAPLLDNTSLDLNRLKSKVADFATKALTSKGAFVMFNSVYGENGAEVCAVPIGNHLCESEDEAIKHPVNIYVERSIAKVKVGFGDDVKNALTENGLALKNKAGEALKVGNKQVYLKLDGWRLTAETDNGRLVKNIDPTWTSTWWNGPAGSHRSFWAINSPSAKNKYYSYNNINNNFSTPLYTNENAADYSEGGQTITLKDTKVILKGTLCDEDGNPLTIVRHLGSHFPDTYNAENPSENLPELKKNILAQLENNGHTYYYKTETGRQQITADDLQIVVAGTSPVEDSEKNCYVYAQLTEAAKNKTWYNSLDEKVTETVNADNINKNLADKNIVDWALVWQSGKTYYYYEIIHNKGTDTGQPTYGVVRNHIYDTKVTKIAGLGTPVYNPDNIIYPEKPDSNDHYIAAEINILSWRVVSNDYQLEW